MSDVRKLPEITRDDVRALVAQVGDGTIPAADIYRAYEELVAGQDREPVSKKALGLALRDAHQRSVAKSINRKNVRCWVIRSRYLEWLEPEES